MRGSGRRLRHLGRGRIGGKPLRQGGRRNRKRDVPNLAARLDEPRHRAAAAELAVVGVGCEDERLLPLLDQTGTASLRSTGAAGSTAVGARCAAASASSPTSSQVVESSKKSL